MSKADAAPVVIVGAGPAGLTAALLLARQGIPVRVLERHVSTSLHPRARGLNVRTMEIYRSLGLQGAIEAAGAELAASRFMLFVETLAGHEIRRVPDDDLVVTGAALAAYTPCTWTQCAQDALEPLLLAQAQGAGALVQFGCEAQQVTQDADGVTVEILDRATGAQSTIHAAYLLAADGAKGHLRADMGIPLRERAVQGHYVNCYFRADLRALVHGREFALCFVENPIAPGILLAVNNTDRWLFNAEYDPQTTDVASFTPERSVELIRAAVGVADLPVEVLSILPWDATARYAAQVQRGRVFLLGDAAHTMPPAGGLGLNTGVAEAHNLAWKLAMMLKGEATPTLLDTYQAERFPIAQAAVEQGARELEAERPDAPPEEGVDTLLGPILGMPYTSTAIIPDGVAARPGLDLTGRPGTRLPHLWVERNGQRLSTLDLVGDRFTLLVGPDGHAWCDAVRDHEIVTCSVIGGTGAIQDGTGTWATAVGITATGAVLVRPDGIIAWRAQQGDEGQITDIDSIVQRVLGQLAD